MKPNSLGQGHMPVFCPFLYFFIWQITWEWHPSSSYKYFDKYMRVNRGCVNKYIKGMFWQHATNLQIILYEYNFNI